MLEELALGVNKGRYIPQRLIATFGIDRAINDTRFLLGLSVEG